MSRGRRRAGFTLFELVIVICIVAFLAAVLVERLRGLEAAAEQAAMEHVIGAVRSAVALEVASHVARGAAGELGRLLGTNPMDRLAECPGNYLGVLDGPDPGAIEGGHWYFDARAGLLVYRVRFARFLETGLPGPARVRFKFQWDSSDYSPDGRWVPPEGSLQGITVAVAEPYRWLDPFATEKD